MESIFQVQIFQVQLQHLFSVFINEASNESSCPHVLLVSMGVVVRIKVHLQYLRTTLQNCRKHCSLPDREKAETKPEKCTKVHIGDKYEVQSVTMHEKS